MNEICKKSTKVNAYYKWDYVSFSSLNVLPVIYAYIVDVGKD